MNDMSKLRIVQVRMKDTKQCYIDYKFELLCIGYCNHFEKKLNLTLNIPIYLKQIIFKYCPKYNDNSLFYYQHGL